MENVKDYDIAITLWNDDIKAYRIESNLLYFPITMIGYSFNKSIFTKAEFSYKNKLVTFIKGSPAPIIVSL